jgi:endonuclease YncB( thermonuclease family)
LDVNLQLALDLAQLYKGPEENPKMNSGLRETWFKFALVASLAVAGSTSTGLAQDSDANRVTGTRLNRSSLSATKAKPTIRVGESEAAVMPTPRENTKPRGQVELIHLPTFGAAGSIEKGSQTIPLVGVVITAVDAQCGSLPDAWPCGRMALAALQRFIRRRSVECRLPEGSAHNAAHCTVGGRDIGEWLVAQGWAKAKRPDYANAENIAQKDKRGIWSSVRPELAIGPVFELGPALSEAVVRAEVHLSTQSMTLVHRGRIIGHWSVSTAREGKETPTGVWAAKWLARHHRSKRYNNAPMPYSVFYDGDYAVHGTYQTARLGRPASAGCVRLSPRHAAVLFNLVRKEGLNNTVIVIRQ